MTLVAFIVAVATIFLAMKVGKMTVKPINDLIEQGGSRYEVHRLSYLRGRGLIRMWGIMVIGLPIAAVIYLAL